MVRKSARPRVLDLVSDHVQVESGLSDLWELSTRDKLAVLAHWSARPPVTRSFRTLVRELRSADYGVLVVSAAEFEGHLDWNGGLAPGTVVLRKPNVGYDFGSWAVGLDFLGSGVDASYVILANDSMVGPFRSIGPILAAFESSRADVWGLTDTTQFTHHIQSYFIGFRNGVLGDPVLRHFFRNIRDERSKQEIIHRNELGLSKILYDEGYVCTAQFRADAVVGPGENPTIRGWFQLVNHGFPFVKREVIVNPEVAPHSERVPELVESLFGAKVADWL